MLQPSASVASTTVEAAVLFASARRRPGRGRDVLNPGQFTIGAAKTCHYFYHPLQLVQTDQEEGFSGGMQAFQGLIDESGLKWHPISGGMNLLTMTVLNTCRFMSKNGYNMVLR